MGKAINPSYKPYHPKFYRRRTPIFWWLRKFSYTWFIGRELTSVCVAYTALMLLVQAAVISRGPAAYEQLVDWLRWPPLLTLHILVLMALLFHSVTWLNLTPKALVLRFGGRRVPDAVIQAAHYAAWIAISILLYWLLTRT